MTPTPVRLSKRQQIENFFASHLGTRFNTSDMHARFGTAFRTRVSEINRDPSSAITVCNKVGDTGTVETSVYWAERRMTTQPQEIAA